MEGRFWSNNKMARYRPWRDKDRKLTHMSHTSHPTLALVHALCNNWQFSGMVDDLILLQASVRSGGGAGQDRQWDDTSAADRAL